MILDFTALDLETTGLNPKTDKIIEAGAVRYRGGLEVASFESLIRPGRKLEERIQQLTGITDRELAQAPEMDEVLAELLSFLGEDVLLGHRILFDYSFVKKAAVNAGCPFEKQGIDTLKIARKLLPELPSRRLPDLCEHFHIPHKAHRAVNDARAAAALYLQLGELAGCREDGELLFVPTPLLYKAKRDVPATKNQKERLYKLLEEHKIITDYEIDKLSRSEASRLADQILSGVVCRQNEGAPCKKP